jgi:hypothetical protein
MAADGHPGLRFALAQGEIASHGAHAREDPLDPDHIFGELEERRSHIVKV